ncbi:MAG: sel1 repeat family protein [Proteobacteria bacterium]|nr:sel1 repeat family protein [Pseudomonadota bacterium]
MRKTLFLFSILFSFSLISPVNAMQGKTFSMAEDMKDIMKQRRRGGTPPVRGTLENLSPGFVDQIFSFLKLPKPLPSSKKSEQMEKKREFKLLVKDSKCLKKLACFPWKLDTQTSLLFAFWIEKKLLKNIWESESLKESAEAKCSYGLLQALDNKFSDALALLTKAAEEGNANAIDNICIMGSRFFDKGEIASAKEWWLVADGFENPEARIKLGIIDEKFKEVSEDPDNGDPAVLSYIKGIGVQFQMKGDRGEAERWFEVLRLAMIKKKSGS